MDRRRSLGERLAEHEDAAFVGRDAELTRIDAVLDGRDERVLVFVHGPGGIGKTTLLRRITERAARLGWDTALHPAPTLAESDREAEALVAWARGRRRALVALDRWDEAGAGVVALRDDVLAALPDTTVIVVAGRARPDPQWWGGAWGRFTLELPLPPLEVVDALRLLALYGVTDPERAAELAGWAAGSPLALVMAAGAGDGVTPRDESSTGALVARLSRRLLEGPLPDERIGPLAVACTARVTTPSLLAAALPGIEAAEAYAWLERQTYSERWAGGITLHALVTGVLRSEIGRRHPDLVREVRRRLADHLWARALRAGTPFVPDLLHLVEDPDLRWGIGWDDRGTYRVDRLRPGDEQELAPHWSEMPGQWSWVRRYLREAPSVVGVARDRTGHVSGLMISVTPRSAPPICAEDPVLGPWLEYARALDPDGNGVLWRVANDLTDRPDNPVQALLGAAGIRRSNLPNPRRVYLPINPEVERAVSFAA
ncbi:MAG TPA: ATP-binding protein, partial [Acidimicrobiales bacterium]|nr:ATP-binding protein [Acidimicrobiales bacterium]